MEFQILIRFTQWLIAAPRKLIWKLFNQVNTGNVITWLELIRLSEHSNLFKEIWIKAMQGAIQKGRCTGKLVDEKRDETSQE